MSETKTNEPVKQEGDFKIKSKIKKMKDLKNRIKIVIIPISWCIPC